MKKNNNNRGKATLGAMIAAGMTASALTAGCGKAAQTSQPAPLQPQRSNVELTAADKVVVDGQEVTIDDVAPAQDPKRQVAKPMYGVRQNPIRLLYGPRPNPRIRPVAPDNQEVAPVAVVEDGVKELIATMLDTNSRNVQIVSKLDEDLKLSSEQRKQLKTELETKFDVVIPDDTFHNLKTVLDVINCICVLKY